jgi:outer membrane protein with beta-barrel domain
MRAWVAVAVLLAAAATTNAQTVEITPVGGYRLGGSLTIQGASSILGVADSGAFGVHLGVKVAPDGEIEALFAREDTHLESNDGLFSSKALFALKLDTYQLGGSYLFRDEDAKVRPFIGLGLGVTRLGPEPADLQSETRFCASLAGGVKAYVGPHLGFRVELRGFFTVIDSESRIFCGPGLPCVVTTKGSDISQAEIRGGVIFRF